MSTDPTPEQSQPTTMSETPETDQQPQQEQESPPTADSLTQKLDKMNISSTSFSIWPPTQRTREAVTNRLIETLSTPSVLSKRYGTIPPEEASATAKSIEEEAFAAAFSGAGDDSSANAGSADEGIEILGVYSKEISKRVLEAVKSRASAGGAGVGADVGSGQAEVGSGDASEDVSAADNQSST